MTHTFFFRTTIDGRNFITPIEARTAREARALLMASLWDGETVLF